MMEQRIAQLEGQLVHLSSQLARLGQSPVHGLPKGVKVQAPAPFYGKADGDTVKNFIDQMDNYFALMKMSDGNQCARYVETLMLADARTWFSTKGYDLVTLTWLQLKNDLRQSFRPADYRRQARKALVGCRQISPDVTAYIAKFNQLYNRCDDVSETDAKFFFEEGLWREVAMQVLAQSPSSLVQSQALAQRISSLLFHNTKNGQRKDKFQHPHIFPQQAIQQSTQNNSGYAPMELGQAHGRQQKPIRDSRTCYRCGKQGHIKRDCKVNLQRQQNNQQHQYQQQHKAQNFGRVSKLERECGNFSKLLNVSNSAVHPRVSETVQHAVCVGADTCVKQARQRSLPACGLHDSASCSNMSFYYSNVEHVESDCNFTTSLQDQQHADNSHAEAENIHGKDKHMVQYQQNVNNNSKSKYYYKQKQLNKAASYDINAQQVADIAKDQGIAQLPDQSASQHAFTENVVEKNASFCLNQLAEQHNQQNYNSKVIQKVKLSSVVDRNCPKLLEIPVRIQNVVVNALVDSGATHSFISVEQLAKFQVNSVNPSSSLVVTLANQSEVTCSGAVELLLYFDSIDCVDKNSNGLTTSPKVYSAQQTFHVLNELSNPIVLGMDFLQQTNPCIDWLNHQLCFDDVLVNSMPFNGKSTVELCSMKSLMHTAKTTHNPAWFVLLRECPSTKQSTHVGTKFGTQISALCDEFDDVFAEPTGLPPVRGMEYPIKLVDENKSPPRPRQYRLSQPEIAEVKKQITDMLSKGWIRPSVSPYGAPILFVRKRSGELRMCVDFRILNRNTRLDQHPIPRIADLLDKLSKARLFSSIDLANAYHQIRIEESDQFKTAFLTPFGLYEYTVMPFGLTNCPSHFQRVMNHTFGDYEDFTLVYLDDILVYSETEEQHLVHLRKVFERLRTAQFKAKRRKCEFAKSSILYLGHYISHGKVSIDPGKTDAISSWPVPQNVKEIQQFVGLANYYNSFIPQFAQIAAPLTALLQKNTPFEWRAPQQQAFETLKQRLCSSPILRLPDFERDFIVETDCSDDAAGAVLFQQYGDCYHPVEYFSKKLIPAERNYSVHDRELLAIFKACMKWRCYLDGRHSLVYTDHKPLTHIWTQPYLNRRQAKWLERLSELSLQIVYNPGILQVTSDTLSRKPSREQQYLSSADQIHVDKYLVEKAPLLSTSACVSAAVAALSQHIPLTHLQCPKCANEHLDDFPRGLTTHVCRSCGQSWTTSLACLGNPLAVFAPKLAGKQLLLSSPQLTTLSLEPSFLASVFTGQSQDSDLEMKRLRQLAEQDANFTFRTVQGFKLLYRVCQDSNLQLVIPSSRGLREMLLCELHASCYAAHLGIRKTLSALSRRVWWPGIARSVTAFVRGCSICQRVKTVNQLPQGQLAPLPIPDGKFQVWTIDFITSLPPSHNCNAVLVCVDKFSKFTKLIPCWMGESTLSARNVARLFFDNVVRSFGIPDAIIHDRDPRFTSSFWQSLWQILGSRTLFSSAYHPQTDGQTERQNRTVAQCIRALVHETGTDWYSQLSLVELAINSTKSDSTGVSPHVAVYGQDVALPADKLDGLHGNQTAQQQVVDWESLYAKMRIAMNKAQKSQSKYANRRRRDVSFEVGDLVLLDSRNLQISQTKKLLDRFVGPYEVIGKVGLQAYRIKLTGSLQKLHNVFHVSLLKKFEDNGLSTSVPPPVVIDDTEEYEVQSILSHRTYHGQPQYLVKWVGYGDEENQWLPESELVNCSRLLQKYKRVQNL